MLRNKEGIHILLETPIIEWRRHNTFTIERKDYNLLTRILPPNVQKVYVNDRGKTLDIKLILFG